MRKTLLFLLLILTFIPSTAWAAEGNVGGLPQSKYLFVSKNTVVVGANHIFIAPQPSHTFLRKNTLPESKAPKNELSRNVKNRKNILQYITNAHLPSVAGSADEFAATVPPTTNSSKRKQVFAAAILSKLQINNDMSFAYTGSNELPYKFFPTNQFYKFKTGNLPPPLV
ncbi:hypothetical protein FACS189429_8420 [Bacteroidia bacterium]|nr:hypothetical protein FACS189429_8420 [Bacteroidia bacterium]